MNFKKITFAICIFLFLLFYPQIIKTENIPESILNTDRDEIFLGHHMQIYEDKTGKLTIKDILSEEFNGEFRNSNSKVNNFGYTDSSIWVRFKLFKSDDEKSRSPWVIVNEFASIHYVDFYHINSEGAIKTFSESGILRPVNTRDHDYYKPIFFAVIPNGFSETFYLKFKSDSLFSIKLKALQMTKFTKDSRIRITFIGMFIGIFLVLAGYHLFLFFTNREFIHIYFSLIVTSVLLFSLSFIGFASLHLWPDVTWLNLYSVYIFGTLLQIFLIKFIGSFFIIKPGNLFVRKLTRIIIFSLFSFTLLAVTTGSYIALTITKFLLLLTFISIPVIILSVKSKSEKKAFYFICGTLIMTITVLVFLAEKLCLTPSFAWSEIILRIGPILFILLTSLSLAERTKALRLEKDKFELDLKDSRQRFKSIVESSYDIIWETDKNGVFTYISPNVKNIVGFDTEHMLGKRFNDTFISAEDKTIYNPFSDSAKVKKPVVGLINSISGPYKKKISFETNALPFFNNENSFLGYRGINREITDRLRSEKIQETIFNISNAVNTSINIDQFYEIIHSELNKIVDATNFFVGIYEKETDSIVLPYLKDEKDKYEKIDAEGTISALVIKENKSLLLKPPDIIRLETEGKIGIVGTPSKIWLGVPLQLDSEVIGLLVLQSYEDENAYSETDLKLMEFISGQIAVSITKKQIDERMHILAQSVEQSPTLVIITDLNANIEYVNKKFEETTGYSMEDMQGENPSILKSGKIPKSTYDELWNRLNQGKEWRGEFHNCKKNGEFYWELAFITPIKNELGKISHYLAIKEDITERKELELQLMQSQKMESVGTLAGGISHDFNNILTVINGYSDLALMRLKKTDPLYEEVSTIKKAGKRGEKLTRQIMAFSRKQIFHPLVIDINDVIEGLENMLKSLIEEDFIITFDLCPDIPLIKADPGQIEQILINLLVNARDAINLKTEKAHKKRIVVKTGIQFVDEKFIKKHFVSTQGPHIYISVEDNGIGMSDDVRQNIFEPFFTTKIRGKGTGMGLATVYGIVKQNNSSILVFSTPGKGTTFQILWPVTTEKLSIVDSKEISDSELFGQEVILFVEDDKHVKDFAVTALEDFGYKVHSAINGKHAFDFVNENNLKFDLLITDLVMPVMNGRELSEKILRLYPDIRILFTSGYTENQLVKSGELEENINFLPKPYTAKSLLTFVRRILKSKE